MQFDSILLGEPAPCRSVNFSQPLGVDEPGAVRALMTKERLRRVVTLMNHATAETAKRWKASELRKLPPEQRNAILEAAAIQAEAEYRNDKDLTAFEAYGKDDLHGDSASTQTR